MKRHETAESWNTPLSKQGHFLNCHRVRFKVMLRGTIRNDYSVAQHSVAMLEQCCTYSKQCLNHVATLCCAKNRPCESPRVTSPLKGLYGTSVPNLPLNTCQAGHASWSRKLVKHYTSSLSPNFTYRTGTYVHNCKFTRGNQTTLQSIYGFAWRFWNCCQSLTRKTKKNSPGKFYWGKIGTKIGCIWATVRED